METTARFIALACRDLPFDEYAGEFCGLAVSTALDDATLNSLLHNYHLRCLERVRPRVRTSPLSVPPTAHQSSQSAVRQSCLLAARQSSQPAAMKSSLPIAAHSSLPADPKSSSPAAPESSSLAAAHPSSSPFTAHSSPPFAAPKSCPPPSAAHSMPPAAAHVPLGLLVAYEGMCWAQLQSPLLQSALQCSLLEIAC